MSNKSKALVAIVTASIIGGAVASVTKLGLTQMPPLSFSFLRFLLASIILLPFAKKKKNTLSKLKPLFLLSVLPSINIMLFVTGIKLTTATVGQLIYAISPLLTVCIAYRIGDEKIFVKKLLGIVVGFTGVFIVLFLPIIDSGQKFSGDFFGNTLITVGAIMWSFYLVYSQRAHKAFSSFMLTYSFFLVCTFLLFPLFIYELFAYPLWWNGVANVGVTSLLYVTIFSTVISYFLVQKAISLGGSVLASLNSYIAPIVSYISAYILLGEKLTWGIVSGGILAMLGIFLVSSNSRN